MSILQRTVKENNKKYDISAILFQNRVKKLSYIYMRNALLNFELSSWTDTERIAIAKNFRDNFTNKQYKSGYFSTERIFTGFRH